MLGNVCKHFAGPMRRVIVDPFYKRRKDLREVKWLAQGHIVWELKPTCLTPKPVAPTHYCLTAMRQM